MSAVSYVSLNCGRGRYTAERRETRIFPIWRLWCRPRVRVETKGFPGCRVWCALQNESSDRECSRDVLNMLRTREKAKCLHNMSLQLTQRSTVDGNVIEYKSMFVWFPQHSCYQSYRVTHSNRRNCRFGSSARHYRACIGVCSNEGDWGSLLPSSSWGFGWWNRSYSRFSWY